MEKIEIHSDYIKLDQFLKWAGIADSGSFAKLMIQNEDVFVNGEVCTERGKKLVKGDKIEVTDAGSFEII
jgi:ribosome-associated protein